MVAATGAMLYVRPLVNGQCAHYDVSIVAGPTCGVLSSPTLGRGINEAGRVAGYYTVCAIGGNEAFFGEGGPDLTTLQRPPGIAGASAEDISDAGLIAGTMTVEGVGARAFVHDGTGFIDLGVPPGAIHSFGRGINNRGDVVGKWGTGNHAFLYRDDVMIDLMPDLGTPSGEALDINDQGQVTGWMGISHVQGGEAFIWQDGKVIALGHLPSGSFSIGLGMNEVGQVAGWEWIGEFPEIVVRPFRWDKGQMINLGILPALKTGGLLESMM